MAQEEGYRRGQNLTPCAPLEIDLALWPTDPKDKRKQVLTVAGVHHLQV